MNDIHNAAADEAAIRDLIARQLDSWNVGDPISYARTYASDADCVNFLGAHYRGRDTIAASGEVPRPGSLLKKLTRGARLEVHVDQIRFLTRDGALIHASGGLARRGRPLGRRNRRTNTSVAVRTTDGWLVAASQNTTWKPFAGKLLKILDGQSHRASASGGSKDKPR